MNAAPEREAVGAPARAADRDEGTSERLPVDPTSFHRALASGASVLGMVATLVVVLASSHSDPAPHRPALFTSFVGAVR